MRKANYQKCPNCSIWVQKLAGCQYINCKCGCAFCYVCGIRFEEDPCRMRSEWKYQDEIRSELSNIKYRLPLEKSRKNKFINRLCFSTHQSTHSGFHFLALHNLWIFLSLAHHNPRRTCFDHFITHYSHFFGLHDQRMSKNSGNSIFSADNFEPGCFFHSGFNGVSLCSENLPSWDIRWTGPLLKLHDPQLYQTSE